MGKTHMDSQKKHWERKKIRLHSMKDFEKKESKGGKQRKGLRAGGEKGGGEGGREG